MHSKFWIRQLLRSSLARIVSKLPNSLMIQTVLFVSFLDLRVGHVLHNIPPSMSVVSSAPVASPVQARFKLDERDTALASGR